MTSAANHVCFVINFPFEGKEKEKNRKENWSCGMKIEKAIVCAGRNFMHITGHNIQREFKKSEETFFPPVHPKGFWGLIQ